MISQQKGKVENSLTVLLVSDLEKSKEYYQQSLGCDVTDWWAVRDDFGLGFKLLQASNPNDVRPNKDTWNTYAYVKDHDTLDVLYQELKSNGAIILQEPRLSEEDWGTWKDFSVQDPDGYIIGFGSGSKKD
jgi:lactoylglutathione lyase